MLSRSLFLLSAWLIHASLLAQCGPNVPSFQVNLTSSTNATWSSPWVQRQDNCCGTQAPDVCVEFIITLHPLAQGIIFDVCDGAVSGGSMFYQLGCGPNTSVGQPLCLSGPGPHVITFCKPGNNTNIYCITSVPPPSAGPDIGINDGCTGQLTTNGFAPGTVQWTSIFPGVQGQYNNYLGCSSCANTTIMAQPGYPAFVDLQVCGNAISPCSNVLYCDTVRVHFFSTLTASIIPPTPTICYGGTGVTLSAIGGGGTAPYTYLWSTGETTPSIQVNSGGTYTVLLGDTSGCPPTSAQVVVTEFTQPITAQAGGTIALCGGATSVVLNGAVTGVSTGIWSGGGGTYSPSNNDLNATYTLSALDLASGSVQLTLTTTGNMGCPPDDDILNIQVSQGFQNAQVITYDLVCHGGAAGSAAFVPALPGNTYAWDDPGNQSGPTAFGLTAGVYTVTVTDQLGCDITLSATITEPPLLVIDTIQAIPPTCNGMSNGALNAIVSGGTPGYTYQWSGNAGGGTSPTAGNLGPGTFILLVSDANGCSAQGSQVLTAPPPLFLSATIPDTVCVNAPVQLTAQATGGTGALSISWQGIGNGPSLIYSFPTAQNVTVVVTDANGCTGPTVTQTVEVLDLSNASLIAFSDTTVCPGGSATVRAELTGYVGPVNYTWPQLGLTGPGPYTIPVPMSQVIDVLASDVCGAVLTDAVSLDLEQPPNLVLPPLIAEGCAPLTVQLPGFGNGLSYQWNLGNGTSSNQPSPLVTYGSGTYQISVQVTTPIGCTASSTTPGQVIARSSPVADFTATPWSAPIGQPTIDFTDLSQSNIVQWDWTFGDGGWSDIQDPSHTYTYPGIYPVRLSVQNAFGCAHSVQRNVEIVPDHEIIIPTAFTPNGNGGSGYYDPNDLSNDIFYPFVQYVEDFRMRIYNRWGELIFESLDVRIGWDGFYRGALSPQDAYVYQVYVRFVDGKEVERTGGFTLVR